MSTPDGLAEELALERLALAELEADALACYRRGQYALWTDARREAELARERIAELEGRLKQQPLYATTDSDGRPITVRQRGNGFQVFVGGWRVATLKTEPGAIARAEHEARPVEDRDGPR